MSDSFQLTLSDSTREKMAQIELLFHNEAAFDIHNQQDLDYISDLVRKLKAGVKDIEADRSALTSPLETAKKAIIAEFKPLQERCAAIEAQCKAAINKYLNEQERKRREAQAILDEKARKEREKLEARAAKAEEKGQVEKADELTMIAGATQAPVLKEVAKPQGVSGRMIWSAEVTDKTAFVAAALTNPVLMAMIQIDQKRLNQMATMLNEEFDVPGAVASCQRSLAIRA